MKIIFWAIKALIVCISAVILSFSIYYIKEFGKEYMEPLSEFAKDLLIRNSLLVLFGVVISASAVWLYVKRNKKRKGLRRAKTLEQAKQNKFLDINDIKFLRNLRTLDGIHFDELGRYIIFFYITSDKFFSPNSWNEKKAFIPRGIVDNDDHYIVPVVLKQGDGDMHPLTLGEAFVASCEIVLNLEAVGARSRAVVRCQSIGSFISAFHLPFFAFGILPLLHYIQTLFAYSIENEFKTLLDKLYDEKEELSEIRHIVVKGYELHLDTIWGEKIKYSVRRPCMLSARVDLIRLGFISLNLLTNTPPKLKATLAHSVSKTDRWLKDAADDVEIGADAAEDVVNGLEKNVSKATRNKTIGS